MNGEGREPGMMIGKKKKMKGNGKNRRRNQEKDKDSKATKRTQKSTAEGRKGALERSRM